MSFSNMIIDQEKLRERLKLIIRSNPDSGRNLSKDIGISTPTLIKFLSNKGTTSFKSLCIIDDWVKSKE